MEIPATAIQQLRDRGLFVADPQPDDCIYPGGVVIGKPISVQGHTIPEYKTRYGNVDGSLRVEFDAPTVWLFPHAGKWVVLARDYTGYGGPGDFFNNWDSVDDAVADVIDFYFGDPARMEAKAAGRQRSK